MGPQPGSSSSSPFKAYNEDTCESCRRTLRDKDILRVLLLDHLTVILMRIRTKNGRHAIRSKSMVNFFIIRRDESQRRLLLKQYKISDLRPNFDTQREIFTPFINRFSNYLRVNVQPAILNVLSSRYTLILDFDLQKLVQLSDACIQTIEDTASNIFCQPMYAQRTIFDRKNWFDLVDRGYIMPIYVTRDYTITKVARNYMECVHAIERKQAVIRWFFLRLSADFEIDTFRRASGKRKTIDRGNIDVSIDEKEPSQDHHVVHVFRYYSDIDYCSKQNCPYENEAVAESLRNHFIHVKAVLPFVICNRNPQATTYIFNIIYKDGIKLTTENFYQSLIMLHNILLERQIHSIVLQSCDSFNAHKFINVIRHVFSESDITVTIVGPRSALPCFGKRLRCY